MSELDRSHRSHLDLPGSGIREVHITRASDGSTYGSQPPRARCLASRPWGAPSSQGRLRDSKGREKVRRRFGRSPIRILGPGFSGSPRTGSRGRWAQGCWTARLPAVSLAVHSLPRGRSRRGGSGKGKGVDDVLHRIPLGIGLNGGKRKLWLGLRSGEAPASMVRSPSGS
jgi:hypothetical protein